MSAVSKLLGLFRGSTPSRKVVDRIGGRLDAPVEVHPWQPSERPPTLPWEQDESGPDDRDPMPTHDTAPTVEDLPRPVPITDWRSDRGPRGVEGAFDENVDDEPIVPDNIDDTFDERWRRRLG